MAPNELKDFKNRDTYLAYLRGARAFSAWLIDQGCLDHQDEDDRRLIDIFIDTKQQEADNLLVSHMANPLEEGASLMPKPKFKVNTPEAYEQRLRHARRLKADLAVTQLTGKELGLMKAEVIYAWKEVHDMAIDMAQDYGSKAKSALVELLFIS